jgi:hypothetical protein
MGSDSGQAVKLTHYLEEGLIVHLRRYSKALVQDTFMQIEEPETELVIPVRMAAFVGGDILTIGEFYRAIAAEIARQGEALFTPLPGPSRQITPAHTQLQEIIEVTDVASALSAIELIVRQGEGTAASAAGGTVDSLAHFYRFQQLVKGMQAVRDPTPGSVGFVFDPALPIVIDEATEVLPMVDDPQTVVFAPEDAAIEALSNACDREYSDLLRTLQAAFDGQPERLADAEDAMTSGLRPAIRSLLAVSITAGPHAGLRAGPRFRFVT